MRFRSIGILVRHWIYNCCAKVTRSESTRKNAFLSFFFVDFVRLCSYICWTRRTLAAGRAYSA